MLRTYETTDEEETGIAYAESHGATFDGAIKAMISGWTEMVTQEKLQAQYDAFLAVKDDPVVAAKIAEVQDVAKEEVVDVGP